MIDTSLFLKDLYFAYLEVRQHKRNAHTQSLFEQHLEDNLMKLCHELLSGTHEISPVLTQFHTIMNSYPGFFLYYKSYRKRVQVLTLVVDKKFWEYFMWNEDATKVLVQKNYLLLLSSLILLYHK